VPGERVPTFGASLLPDPIWPGGRPRTPPPPIPYYSHMPIFSISTISTGFGDARGRAYAFTQRPASPIARFLASLAALAFILVALALVLILLIPAIAIALVIVLYAMVSRAIRRALRATREPNGILDGRRNVRVVVREQEAP
jgi:hypothetical protein